MKAMVLQAIAPIEERPLEFVDLPMPEPGPGELRVRVQTCGVCRTDLHVIEGDLPRHTLPIVPGHQVVGLVDKLGPSGEGFAVGQRVGIAWLRYTCGDCRWCRAGQENLCPESLYTGYHADGGYAEYAVVRASFAYPIPERFDDLEAAPLLCAGIIGYRSLQRSGLPRGGRIALYGFGSSAHVVMQLALHRGCTVDVVTRGEIVPGALRAVRKGGTVACAGIYMTPIPEMEYDACLFHEKSLLSVEANTRDDGRGLLAEAAEVPGRARVTEFPLEEANEALIRLKHDGIDGSAVLRVADRSVTGSAA